MNHTIFLKTFGIDILLDPTITSRNFHRNVFTFLLNILILILTQNFAQIFFEVRFFVSKKILTLSRKLLFAFLAKFQSQFWPQNHTHSLFLLESTKIA